MKIKQKKEIKHKYLKNNFKNFPGLFNQNLFFNITYNFSLK